MSVLKPDSFNSRAVVLYQASSPSKELTFLEKSTQKAYMEAMQLEKETQRLLEVGPCVTIKLHSLLNEMLNIHRDGKLNGEVLIARGEKFLLNLRSEKVSEITLISKEDPQFMIGSVSKQFFAVGLLKALYDFKAKGSNDDEKTEDIKRLLLLPLSYFLPEDHPIWDSNMPLWANEITLHQLLSHTSGLPNYTDKKDCIGYEAMDVSGKRWCEYEHSIAELLKILPKDLKFKPGSEFSYCNTGYRLIAEVIKSITGTSGSRYITEALLKPLNLSSTYSPESKNADELRELDPNCKNLVKQYCYDLSEDQKLSHPSFLEDMSAAQGDGSIISTTFDLLKWNIALHQKKVVLPLALYKLFISENTHNYAYGICNADFYGGVVLSHGGKIGDFTSDLVYLPESEISIIRLSNISVKESLKLDQEFDELMERLKDKIPDESKRADFVSKIMTKKYPDKIGSNLTAEIIASFFKDE